MKLKRRHLVGGTSALVLASGASAALGQSKSAVCSPTLIATATEATGFEAALRSKLATGDVLNWTGGNVLLKRPIHIDVTHNMLGGGIDLNGAKVVADFNDATQRAITIRIPPGHKKVSVRGMKFFNGTIVAETPALDGLGLICMSNQSWIYSWKIMNLDVENFTRDGLYFAGSVFEGELHAVTCSSNGRNGMTFRNDGPKDDTGIVSSVAIFGGQLRKNGNAGIETQSAIPYQEPRDLNIRQTFFVENKGPGFNAPAGFSRTEGCGFHNNGGCGVNLMNEGRMTDCRGSTHGLQPYLVKAFFNNGGLIMDSCRVEGFYGFEGKMKLGKFSGDGTVTLRDSGQASDCDIQGDVTVKVA